MTEAWRFIHFLVFVTGKGEKEFIGKFLRVLSQTGHCAIHRAEFIPQRNPRGEKKAKGYQNSHKRIPKKDEDIGAKIRSWLAQSKYHYVVWVDDLESSQRPNAKAKFDRMRLAGDVMLAKLPELQTRWSVHFFVNMVEAYYFAHPEAVQQVLQFELNRHDGDCENILHPKNELKRLAGRGGFDEREHGARIVSLLDLDVVLSNPEHCRALRTLIAWCWEAIGEARTDRFQLHDGIYWDVTAHQLVETVPPGRVGPLSPETSYLPVG